MYVPIVSICTPLIKSAIGVIRISFGNLKLNIVNFLLKKIFKKNLKIRYATYSTIFDENDNILDKGIAILFKSPYSYTGENILEFHGHGNPINLNYIVFKFLSFFKFYNIRLAKPGEFTKRAFVNKKINLVEIEMIINIINSNSILSLNMIHKSLKFNLSLKIKNIINIISSLEIYLYKNIDFFYLKRNYINYKLTYLLKKLFEIKEKFKNKNMTNLPFAIIIGNTNVGKSTIMNKLFKNNFVIVTNKPGTTRDTVVRLLNFDNYSLNIRDTAGLRFTKNKIEKLGIKLVLKQIKNSNIIIHVFDNKFYINYLNIKNYVNNIYNFYISIFNKIDLVKNSIVYLEFYVFKNKNIIIINLSAKDNLGVNLLYFELKRLTFILYSFCFSINSKSNFNKYLKKAYSNIFNSFLNIKNLKPELLLENLKFSKYYLGNIINLKKKNIINKLFNNFCVGK